MNGACSAAVDCLARLLRIELRERRANIVEHLFAQARKGLACAPGGFAHAPDARMGEQVRRAQRALRVTQEEVALTSQPPAEGIQLEGGAQARVEEHLPVAQGFKLRLVQQHDEFVQAREDHLAAGKQVA